MSQLTEQLVIVLFLALVNRTLIEFLVADQGTLSRLPALVGAGLHRLAVWGRPGVGVRCEYLHLVPPQCGLGPYSNRHPCWRWYGYHQYALRCGQTNQNVQTGHADAV